MTVEELLKEKREAILAAAEKHGAKNLRVFGSVARGEADRHSDIDLLVETGDKTSPWFPAGLVLELEDILGCEVDVVTENALHWYIRDEILAQAIKI